MKKIIALTIALALFACMFSACSSKTAETSAPTEAETATSDADQEKTGEDVAGTPAEKVLIGWSANGLNGPNSHSDEVIKAYFADKDDVKLISTNAELDATQQIADIETLIEMGCSVIMLKPQDSTSLVNVLREAMDAGITIILVEALVFDANGEMVGDMYVGYDDVTIGRTLGEEVVKKADGKPYNICIYEGQDGNTTFATRLENFLEVISAYDNIHILGQQSGPIGRSDDMRIAENFLSAYDTDINGIVAFTDESAIGAAMALDAEGYCDTVDVFTCNGTCEAMRYMIDGGIDVLLALASGSHPSVGIAYMIATGQATAEDFPESMYGGIKAVDVDLCEEYLSIAPNAYRMDDIDPKNNVLFTEPFSEWAKTYPAFENYPFE